MREAIAAIVAVLDAVEKHYRKTTTAYEHVSHFGDAETLLYVIRDGIEARDEQFRRLKGGGDLAARVQAEATDLTQTVAAAGSISPGPLHDRGVECSHVRQTQRMSMKDEYPPRMSVIVIVTTFLALTLFRVFLPEHMDRRGCGTRSRRSGRRLPSRLSLPTGAVVRNAVDNDHAPRSGPRVSPCLGDQATMAQAA